MTSRYWDDRYASSELVWGSEPNRFLEAEASALAPGRALDVACGEGRNAIWLARLGWEVTAVDFSPVAIERAEALASEARVAVRWLVADILEFDPGEGAFDLVVVAYLHLPAADRATVLAAASRAVAPGGRIFVVAHDVTNLEEGYGGPQDAAILPSPDEIASEIGGLEVIRAEHVAREVATPDGPRTAIDALVVASQRGS